MYIKPLLACLGTQDISWGIRETLTIFLQRLPIINWDACGTAQFVIWVSFFSRGVVGGGGISGK